MGDLTNNVNLPIGSSIGQIPEPQPSSANAVFNSAVPVVANWILTGLATLVLKTADQFDGGFIPVALSGKSVADFVTNSILAVNVSAPANTLHTVSGEFSIDTDFAGIGVNPQSTSVTMRVNWLDVGNVLLRADSITFNPASGNVTATAGIVSGFQSTPFTARLPNGSTQVDCFKVAFQATSPANTSKVQYEIVPCATAAVQAAAFVECGAFQLEQLGLATSYIGNSVTGISTIGSVGSIDPYPRPIGATPRQTVDRSRPLRVRDSTNAALAFTYEWGTDNGTCFFVQGGTVNIPVGPVGRDVYETLTIINLKNASSALVQALAGNNVTFFGPSFDTITTGVASFQIPQAPANQAGYAVTLVLFSSKTGATECFLVESNIGPFDTGGNFVVPATGVTAGKILRSNGTNYVASQSTYPDIVGANNVMVASAANTVASFTNFKYNDTAATGLILNNLLDISGAAGGQIKFPASANPSSNVNTFDDCERGTWTPTDGSGAGLALTSSGYYVKNGRHALIGALIIYPVTANGANAKINGLPFTVENNGIDIYGGAPSFTNSGVNFLALMNNNTTTLNYYVNPTGITVTNVNFSNSQHRWGLTYKSDT